MPTTIGPPPLLPPPPLDAPPLHAAATTRNEARTSARRLARPRLDTARYLLTSISLLIGYRIVYNPGKFWVTHELPAQSPRLPTAPPAWRPASRSTDGCARPS